MNTAHSNGKCSRIAELIVALPAEERAVLLQAALSFDPQQTSEDELRVSPLRAAIATYWESATDSAIPIAKLRSILSNPIPIETVLEFVMLKHVDTPIGIERQIHSLIAHLSQKIGELERPSQLVLFPDSVSTANGKESSNASGKRRVVSSLDELIADQRRYPTVYADPPWQYSNRASRGAAENHYSTLSIDEICREPVRELVPDHAHLHLWTTNGFLREAFAVIDAWGFTYKSCLVWVKDDLGMGNYWRVSHEYLLLGVRGNLRFRSRNQSSWIRAKRTSHSRKPWAVRKLVEKVSPGPYLELYGRESLPGTNWTVYGNQIEKKLF